MLVRAITLSLVIQDAITLKDKRQVLKSLLAKVHNQFNVAIAEIGFHDQWQRSQIGLAFVSNQASHLDRIEQEVINFIETHFPVEVCEIYREDM